MNSTFYRFLPRHHKIAVVFATCGRETTHLNKETAEVTMAPLRLASQRAAAHLRTVWVICILLLVLILYKKEPKKTSSRSVVGQFGMFGPSCIVRIGGAMRSALGFLFWRNFQHANGRWLAFISSTFSLSTHSKSSSSTTATDQYKIKEISSLTSLFLFFLSSSSCSATRQQIRGMATEKQSTYISLLLLLYFVHVE